MNRVIQGDCLEVMKTLDDNSIDCIITSPPYEDISGAGYKANSKDILFFKLYSEFLGKLFTQYARILKEGGQLFFNVKSKTINKTLKTPHWIEFTEGFNLLNYRSYIIWKYAGSFDSTNSRFHLDYEIIYHLSKGDITLVPEMTKDPLTSVWYIPHSIKDRVHPTQMPEKVVEEILLRSGCNGVILDNFMGSGTTGIVAKKMGRDFIGIELNEKHFRVAEKRINSVCDSLL